MRGKLAKRLRKKAYGKFDLWEKIRETEKIHGIYLTNIRYDKPQGDVDRKIISRTIRYDDTSCRRIYQLSKQIHR